MSLFRPYFTDPALRLAAVLVFLLGAVASTFAPHVSVLAVQRFHLGDRGYAALLVISTLIAVATSVGAGIRADQTANRRGIVLISALFWVSGAILMTLHPGPLSFALTHALLFPLAASLMGQVFALAKLAASTHPPEQRDAIMSTLRAMFAAPFVLVLPIWAAAFEEGVDVMTIYPAALVMTGLFLILSLRFWPKDGHVRWEDKPSGLTLRAAVAELANAPLTLRVLALGAVTLGSTLYISVIGLIMGQTAGRSPSDTALFIGLVAGMEVPLMLAMPMIMRGVGRTLQMIIGTAIYAVHLLALPFLIATPFLWLLILPAALGGAVTLTVPIAYLQDLMTGRPGTASSLMALQWLAASLIAAMIFALGTALSGYTLALAIGALASVAGAVWLHSADQRRASVIS